MQPPYNPHKDHSEVKQMEELIRGKPHRMTQQIPGCPESVSHLSYHTPLQASWGNHQIKTLGIRERRGKEEVK